MNEKIPTSQCFTYRDDSKWAVVMLLLQATNMEKLRHVFLPEWLWPFGDCTHCAMPGGEVLFFKCYHGTVLVYPR